MVGLTNGQQCEVLIGPGHGSGLLQAIQSELQYPCDRSPTMHKARKYTLNLGVGQLCPIIVSTLE